MLTCNELSECSIRLSELLQAGILCSLCGLSSHSLPHLRKMRCSFYVQSFGVIYRCFVVGKLQRKIYATIEFSILLWFAWQVLYLLNCFEHPNSANTSPTSDFIASSIFLPSPLPVSELMLSSVESWVDPASLLASSLWLSLSYRSSKIVWIEAG